MTGRRRGRLSEKERARRVRALQRHRGNVARAARQLGIGTSALQGWVRRQGLAAKVERLRPKPPAPAAESARLVELLRAHDGQQWKVQRALGVAKGTLRARLDKHDLLRRAAELRLEANKRGPRKHVRGERYRRAERRDALRALLDSVGWNVRRAVAKSGVSNGRFHALMRELGVERPRALSPQQRLHRLIDALRLFRGNVARVGRSLKVPDAVVRQWCAEFELDARDYRS